MPANVSKTFKKGRRVVLFHGDCMDLLGNIPNDYVDLTITSPPYCIGKEYDESTDIEHFVREHIKILPRIVEATRDGGSICWQVGYHVKNSTVTPLDYLVHDVFKEFHELRLRNRIVWTFGHGTHGKHRFSGRHEIILWYTKGDDYHFDLDAVRVAQSYPGKRHYKGPKKGEFSGNPLGKNPSDVWTDIPNVKANHVEKTDHPCQFPTALAVRLIRALTSKRAVVLDPFAGSGTTGVAAVLEKRKFVGAEISNKYYKLAAKRIRGAMDGSVNYRPLEKPVLAPSSTMAVARKPAHFR